MKTRIVIFCVILQLFSGLVYAAEDSTSQTAVQKEDKDVQDGATSTIQSVLYNNSSNVEGKTLFATMEIGKSECKAQDLTEITPYNPQLDAEPELMSISKPTTKHASLNKRFYEHSGNSALSILSAGYSTYFLFPRDGVNTTQDLGKRHMLNFSVFEWRAKLFGMSLFNFEMGINTPSNMQGSVLTMFQRGGKSQKRVVPADAKTMWFAYKPAMKFYIPLGRMCALELYGGIEVDVTKLWNKINTSYYEGHSEIPEQNFFFGAYGGTGFVFTAVPALPLEIKAEYRHPVKGNKAIVPQGFYLFAQLHLTAPLRRNNTHK